METLPDISFNIPSELLDPISEVIRMGLQRATKITPEQRKMITAWWEAEHQMIRDDQNELEEDEKNS